MRIVAAGLRFLPRPPKGGCSDDPHHFDDPKDIGGLTGKHILYDAGNFRMKEANGEDVKLTENGKEYLVEPTADQIDDLMDAEQLVQEGTLYRLPSKT